MSDTTLEKSHRTGGIGHISAFPCANSISWGGAKCDLAYRQRPRYNGSCIDSGESKGSHLKMDPLPIAEKSPMFSGS